MLQHELRKVAIFHEKKIYFDPPPPLKEQKQLLKAIHDSAEILEDALTRIGPSEYLLIGKHNNYWDRLKTIEVASETKVAAESALVDLDKIPARPGPPTRDAERKLITKLIRIYRDWTGKTDRYSQDPHTYHFKGNLVRFIERVAKILNAPLDNQFIGKEIKKSPSVKS